MVVMGLELDIHSGLFGLFCFATYVVVTWGFFVVNTLLYRVVYAILARASAITVTMGHGTGAIINNFGIGTDKFWVGLFTGYNSHGFITTGLRDRGPTNVNLFCVLGVVYFIIYGLWVKRGNFGLIGNCTFFKCVVQ